MNLSPTQTIYLIRNAVNGKVYVGKTEKTIEQRLYEHKGHARRGGEFRLSQAIRKHGACVFSISEIEVVPDEIAGERERFWIAYYGSKKYSNGYNMTDGGEGASGRHLSEESRQKMVTSQEVRFREMSDADKASLTKAANNAKRGKKEKPSNKKEAQQKRWDNMSDEDRAEHGKRSAAGMSVETRNEVLKTLQAAYSPVRTKGYKQELSTCPKCGKTGGAAAMKRYHFDRCKL